MVKTAFQREHYHFLLCCIAVLGLSVASLLLPLIGSRTRYDNKDIYYFYKSIVIRDGNRTDVFFHSKYDLYLQQPFLLNDCSNSWFKIKFAFSIACAGAGFAGFAVLGACIDVYFRHVPFLLFKFATNCTVGGYNNGRHFSLLPVVCLALSTQCLVVAWPLILMLALQRQPCGHGLDNGSSSRSSVRNSTLHHTTTSIFGSGATTIATSGGSTIDAISEVPGFFLGTGFLCLASATATGLFGTIGRCMRVSRATTRYAIG